MDYHTAHALFYYSGVTGGLYWKTDWYRAKAGDRVGYMLRNYRIVKYDQVKYAEHSIIFLMHHGWMPDITDHIDRDTHNNRIENLREVTAGESRQNVKRKNSTSEYCGVTVKNGSIRTQFDGDIAGYHNTEEEAARHYDAIAHREYGEYAYLNFPEEYK